MPVMIDSDGSRDINDDNKSPNRLSQLFIFDPGYPRFSYALFGFGLWVFGFGTFLYWEHDGVETRAGFLWFLGRIHGSFGVEKQKMR